MADNFNLRSFLSENKLTKNAKLIKEGSDYGYDSTMDAVDDMFEPGTPQHDQLTAAVEDAFHKGDIDYSEYSHSPSAPSQQVAAIARELGLAEAKQEDSMEEAVEEDAMEEALTTKEQALVEMVKRAMGEGDVDYTMGRQDDPNQLPNPAPELNIPEGEEMVNEKPLPKYENIEKLMQEIDKSTDEAAHKYKMEEMKRVADMLEKKCTALEEGEDSDHIDQKKLKQMKKDIMTLRKGIEKMEKLAEKKFASKKESKEDK